MNDIEELEIGADPEFVFALSDGDFYPARSVLPSLQTSDALQYSADEYNFYKMPIGIDGYDVTAEIRPGIAKAPIDIVAKCNYYLKQLYKLSPTSRKLQWLAGHSYKGYTIGGHIHFATESTQRIKKNLLASARTLFCQFEDPKQRKDRQRNNYGTRNDAFENKSYGFEFRMPPSWLISPEVSLFYLSFYKSVVQAGMQDITFKPCGYAELLEWCLEAPRFCTPDCIDGLQLLPKIKKNGIDWGKDFKEDWGMVKDKKEAAEPDKKVVEPTYLAPQLPYENQAPPRIHRMENAGRSAFFNLSLDGIRISNEPL